MTSSFGAMVRGHRDRVGLTQEELAERTGLSVRAIRNLEQGRTARPQWATVRLLAASLSLDDKQRNDLLTAARASADPVATPQVLHGRSLLAGAAVRKVEEGASLVVFSGGPGSGKTSVLRHIAGRLRFETVVHLELTGEEPAEIASLALRALGVSPVPVAAQERLSLLRSVLSGRRVLLALDDVESERQLLPGGVVLAASRYRLPGLAEHTIGRLGPLTDREAVLLLADLADLAGRDRVLAEPAAAAAIAAACAGVPLALRIAGSLAALRPERPLSETAARLADPATRLDRLCGVGLSVRDRIAAHLRRLRPGTLDLLRGPLAEADLTALVDAHLMNPGDAELEPLVALHLGAVLLSAG